MRYRDIFARHKIGRFNGTERNNVIICSEITYYADRKSIRKHCEKLIRFHTALFHFLTEYKIGVLQDLDFFRCYLTHYPDTETGTGKRLTADQAIGQTELSTDQTDLIFKETLERFDYAGKAEIFRKPAYIMMALDDRGFVSA